MISEVVLYFLSLSLLSKTYIFVVERVLDNLNSFSTQLIWSVDEDSNVARSPFNNVIVKSIVVSLLLSSYPLILLGILLPVSSLRVSD